jgi:hypothetical protein
LKKPPALTEIAELTRDNHWQVLRTETQQNDVERGPEGETGIFSSLYFFLDVLIIVWY